MNRTERRLQDETDAQVWAREFVATFPAAAAYEGTMIGWFASAIEVGRAAGRAALSDQPYWREIADCQHEALTELFQARPGTSQHRRAYDRACIVLRRVMLAGWLAVIGCLAVWVLFRR